MVPGGRPISVTAKIQTASNQPAMHGEIMRNALRLIKTRGDGALEFAAKKAEWMVDNGDEEDHSYWENITRQIEILLYEND